jgi:sulfopropanediol 3-dehydrogenase
VAEYLKKAVPPAPADEQAVRDTVSEILRRVKAEGLAAVRDYSRRFDGWDPPSFRVAEADILAARDRLAADVLASLEFAHDQVRHFAELQRASMLEFEEETRPGVFLGQKHIPIANVGAYVPSGKYPMLMSAQMSILTAKVAGVSRVVGCAPPYGGSGIYPEVLWSMHLAGADEIWAVGGVQALAMLAYGVEGLPPVDLIAGPGNMYVAEAKRQLFGTVGIDLLAGPTEILIIADESADPVIVAADLLGQAEHGPTSPAVLVTTSREVADQTLAELDRQLPLLPSAEVIRTSWGQLGEVIVAADADEAVALADRYAPEHLEVQTTDPGWYAERLRNYGTLCVGEEATITFSDKAIGTNHTLPTAGAARYTGGLWVGKFLKTVTFQRCTREGALDIAPHAGLLSDAELMPAHAASAHARVAKYRA